MLKPGIEIVLSPAMLNCYSVEAKIVVVIDIIRASTTVCAALADGVAHMLPLPTKDECLLKKESGYLLMGEKDGEVLEGFDMGNSPRSFAGGAFRGEKIAFSTTNGTQALLKASENGGIVALGSFLNISAMLHWLGKQQQNVLMLCAGWHHKINVEDTLFAGSLGHMLRLNYGFEYQNDGALLAQCFYEQHGDRMFEAIMESNQRERILTFGLEEDTHFSLTHDYTEVIPMLSHKMLIRKPADY